MNEAAKKAEAEVNAKLKPVLGEKLKAVLKHVETCKICQNVSEQHQRF